MANPFNDPAANQAPLRRDEQGNYIRDQWGGYLLEDTPAQTGQPQRDRFGGILIDPQLHYKAERDMNAALGYVKSSIPPEQRQAVENQWRQEYNQTALNRALSIQQQTAAIQPPEEVGRVRGVVNAVPRGATKLVTE